MKLAISALKAGEKNVKPVEVEMAVINGKGFSKYHGNDGIKYIKKYW